LNQLEKSLNRLSAKLGRREESTRETKAGMDEENSARFAKLREEQGLFELVALYKLLLALEAAAPRRKVSLDLKDFESYYDDFSKILSNAKKNFTDKVSVYNYLFTHTIPNNDQVQLVVDKLQALKEDEIIDKVLLPLLFKMGYNNVKRIAYHGPTEYGLDVPLFYELDKFNNRIYYGAPVKAIDVHTNSRKEGHAENISNQLSLALHCKFIDQEDN
jgi:hypothetical protein